ncbi:MAG: MurR/RpiR family transcriptional regulator [Oscillospiraceae bacterium]|nr:MurR/RpiR family transcriptional regulator [Oscillospiraceae bacterium]
MDRNPLSIIRSQLPSLSKGHKAIAQYILAHYDEAAYMSAATLGKLADVSESTVVRFAKNLGYSGYPEFLRELSGAVKIQLNSLQRLGIGNILIGEEDIVDKVLSLDADCVKKSILNVSREQFEAAVDAITKAGSIYVMGVRSSFFLANFLTYYLSMMFKNVKLIASTSTSEMFEQIRAIDEGDIMIGISFPRYSQSTAKAISYAKRRNAKVIAITDSPLSPLAVHADILLTAKCEIVSFVDSLVAPLSVVNALLVAVGTKRSEELSTTLQELEGIWDEYGVYEKGIIGENAFI